jgi:hypothetical protein
VKAPKAIGRRVLDHGSEQPERIILSVAQDRLGGLWSDPARETAQAPAVEDEQHQALSGDTDRLDQGAFRVVQELQRGDEQHCVHGAIAKWEAMGIGLDADNPGLAASQRRQHGRGAIQADDTQGP